MEGVISRFPAEIQTVIRTERYDYSGDARVGVCWLGDLPSTPFAPECAAGPGGREADLLIWGDSHAGRLYAGVRRILGSDVGVGQLTRDECPPLVAFGSANCVEGNAAVLATLERQRPAQILLFGYWDFYARNGREAPAVRTALERTIAALRAIGIQDILVMGPAPRWREGLPRRVYRQWAADFPLRKVPERLASGFDLETFELDAALRPSVEAIGGTYVSVLDILCNADGCLSAVPGSPSTLLAWDYGHLTTAGAELIARRLRAMGLLHVGE
jgi:lysophospholipase L1-like esterase